MKGILPACAGWDQRPEHRRLSQRAPLPEWERGGEQLRAGVRASHPYRRGFPVAIVMFAASWVILLTAL